jgi:flagellar biosynthesis/type III secretory pathway chaperone
VEISFDDFYDLKKLKDDLEALIETIEILNDEKLRNGIKISRKDVEAGRLHELKNIEELDEIWA